MENGNLPKKKLRKLKDFSDGSMRRRVLLTILSLVAGFFLWYLITLIPSIKTFLASPAQVLEALVSEAQANGRYFQDISISLKRVLTGYFLAFVCAVPVAFLMGWYPVIRNLVEPWIQFIRTIPPIALIPLVILALGLGESAKHTIIFVAAFMVMVVTIYQGIREVDKTYIKAAYTFGARDWNLFFDIMIPSSFPYILVAARLGMASSLTTLIAATSMYILVAARLSMASSLTTLIAAELTGTTFGLGARIQGAQQFMNTSVVLLGIITIGVIGYILDKLLLLTEKKLTKWK